jgi:hypothetical protein
MYYSPIFQIGEVSYGFLEFLEVDKRASADVGPTGIPFHVDLGAHRNAVRFVLRPVVKVIEK